MIHTGIAGLGHLGNIHLQQCEQVRDLRVTALYDIDREKLERISRETGIPAFPDYTDFLRHCGAVIVATPTSSHFQYAVPAIREGKHVFIEKPIAEKMSSARKITRLSEEAGVVVQVGHVERFNPAFRAVRDRIESPRFIESHRLSGFDVRGTDVSVILDLMIHDIDIVLSIVPSNVRRVHASGVPVVTGSIDIANARLEFDNGAVANLTASRISMKKMRKMRVFQHNEYMGIDFLNKKVEIFSLQEDGQGASIFPFPDQPGRGIRMERPEVPETNAIREELKAFAHSIRTGREPEVNALQATDALELADQIRHKIRKSYEFSE